MTKTFWCNILDNRCILTPRLRAKDDPYGLAPIRVTEAESKPSILIFLVIPLHENWRGLTTPETSVDGRSPRYTVGFMYFRAMLLRGFLLARPPTIGCKCGRSTEVVHQDGFCIYGGTIPLLTFPSICSLFGYYLTYFGYWRLNE